MAKKPTAANGSTVSPTPKLDELIAAEPDLVDRIFEYIVDGLPALGGPEAVAQLKADVRAEFAGEGQYIAKRPLTERQQRVARVLALFNGRNATGIARQLRMGRATVYRILKQAGKAS